MTVIEGVALGLLAVAFLAAGFLIGNSLGEDPEAAGFGSAPATITTGRSDVQVPKFSAQKGPPSLAVTAVEVATTESNGSEPLTESDTTAPVVEERKEKKTPVKSPAPTTPPPDITVGEEEVRGE